MDVIFNDYSLNAQFSSINKFVDSMYKYMLKPLLLLKECECNILGRFSTYNDKVTNEYTLIDLLKFGKEYPEILRFKSILIDMMYDPFWESNPQTDINSTYYCELLDLNKDIPNSITECIERDRVLLSAEKDEFKEFKLSVKKNTDCFYIFNISDWISANKLLYLKGKITFAEMMAGIGKKYNVEFCKNESNKYYTDNGFETAGFNSNDGLEILDDYIKFLEGIESDDVNEDYHDSVHHKGMTYYEFRTSLTEHRLFRIYYFTNNDKKYFLNSYAKKERSIPDRIKDYTVDIIKKVKLSL